MIRSWNALSVDRVGDRVGAQCVHAVDQLAEPLNHVGVGEPGGDVGHVRLEQSAGHHEIIQDVEAIGFGDERAQDRLVQHVPHRRWTDDRSEALPDLDEAFLLEHLHGLADHSATHREVRAQRRLRRYRPAGRIHSGNDSDDQLGGDCTREVPRASRPRSSWSAAASLDGGHLGLRQGDTSAQVSRK